MHITNAAITLNNNGITVPYNFTIQCDVHPDKYLNMLIGTIDSRHKYIIIGKCDYRKLTSIQIDSGSLENSKLTRLSVNTFPTDVTYRVG